MNSIKHILVADDNPFDVELIIESLKEFNISNRIFVVNDGVEVIEYLKCEGKYKDRFPEMPLFLLLDMNMPKMNGLQVLQIVKKDPKLKTLPIVILTSTQEKRIMQESYQSGTNAFVTKPLNFDEFNNAIKIIGIFWGNYNEVPVEGGINNVLVTNA